LQFETVEISNFTIEQKSKMFLVLPEVERPFEKYIGDGKNS